MAVWAAAREIRKSGRSDFFGGGLLSTQRRPSRSRQLAGAAAGSRHAGWLKFGKIDRLEGEILGVSAEFSVRFRMPQGWSASLIYFFSMWNKENRILIFPVHQVVG
jgi:hypothetical protein